MAIVAVLALVLGWSGMASASYIVDLPGRYSMNGGQSWTNFSAPVIVQPDGSYTLEHKNTTLVSNSAGSIVLKDANGMVSLLDPVQTLVLGVTDAGAPSEFAVALSVPLAPPILRKASFSLTLFGSCTDGAADGCGITPGTIVPIPPAIAGYFVNAFANVVGTRGAAAANATPGGNFPSVNPWSTLTGVFNCGAIVGGCTTFDTIIDITGSGGGDSIGLTARFQIDPIPMPATLMLLGVGLLGAAGFTWRQRRA